MIIFHIYWTICKCYF